MVELSVTYYIAIACVFLLYIFWMAALSVMRSEQLTVAAEGAAAAVAYDNKEPWKSKNSLTGRAARAKSAMNNHAEQFQFFAVGVLLNMVVRGTSGDSIALAVVACIHMLARMLHLICYIEDVDWWRSTAFTLGWLANLVLYCLAFAPDV